VEALQQVASIALVFVLLGAALWAMRNSTLRQAVFRNTVLRGSFARRSGRNIESIERLNLTPQHALHWVRAGGHDLLVAPIRRGAP